MRMRRRENRRRFRGKGAPAQQACGCNVPVAPAPSLADVLKASEHDDEDAAVAPRMVDQPLLDAWPAGYQNGGFRVVDGGVLLSAKGMPTLFLREAEKLVAAAE
jgi:hypothetical protein